MNYLKLIANAVYSGLYVSCLIVFLLLFLNADPAAGARGVATFGKLLAWTMPIYLPLTACLLPTLFLFVRFFAVRRLHAHWFSLKATVWFAVSALGYLTVVYYVNI
ncbi:MAG: hypothetical protein ACE5IK_14345 [Acidobacteriota bacterium]